jgi:predicted GTPase
MSRWRIAVLVGLVLAPVIFLVGFAFYALWEKGWAFWAWWPMAACLALAYVLAWYWQRKRALMPPVPNDPAMHWTDRDRAAWQLVQQEAAAVNTLSPDQLSDPAVYRKAAEGLALRLAQHYQPGAKDPYGRLTVPEMLAVSELVSEDLTELVEKYVPASHMMTIDDWKRARQAIDWYKTASNAYWIAAAFFSPVETALRYTAAQVGMSKPLAKLQENMQQWFYETYVGRVGHYLIELHSGRLRVGAKRYRELMAQHAPWDAGGGATAPPPPPAAEDLATRPDAGSAVVDATPATAAVTLTVMGQVKAGKSSLVNALLGEQRAKADVLPATNDITRYELKQSGLGTLALLDTVGYGHAGPRADQQRSTEEAARQSDAVLLVLHATSPGRQADVEALDRLREWYGRHPELKLPPVIAVVTHIDLLSPVMEWKPPYDWLRGDRRKEQSICQAVEAVRDQFGERLADVVPVCGAAGKVFGVSEALLPSLSAHLDEAHAVGLLRVLYAEANAGKIRKVWEQFVQGGREALKLLWQRAVR